MKILFIGAGNMAQAIINGTISKSIFSPKDIFIYDINYNTKNQVRDKYKINIQNDIDSNISNFDIIILAVKPQVFLNFDNNNEIKKINTYLKPNQLILSIMAGITIDSIVKFFTKNKSIIRIMPNTPALIGQSMSVISYSDEIDPAHIEITKQIFSSIGKIEILEEKYINAVTALSGSGPAYVFTFIEALAQGGVLCGLTKKTSELLAVQTVLGSTLMIKDNTVIEELRHMVTSPGGTTIAGLAELEKRAFRSSVIEAVKSAYERANELSFKTGK